MKTLLKFIIYIALISGVFILQMAFVGLLFFPFNRINIIFLFLILVNNFYPQSRTLWLILPFIFLLEIFSSLPFGLNSISFYLGLLSAHWVLQNLLTNRSVTTVFLSCLISLFIYRFSFLSLLVAFRFFNHTTPSVGLGMMLIDYTAEIIITSSLTALIYFFAVTFIKKLSPRYYHGSISQRRSI